MVELKVCFLHTDQY